MVYAGIESGAKNSKAVIMEERQIIGQGICLTGFDQKAAYEQALGQALQQANISKDQIEATGATGSGKESVQLADSLVNDIKAIAQAAIYFFPSARTVTDVGGEEGRAAKIDKNGQVVDFVINEKCAAGAGAFIEAMARALEVDLEQMGAMALESKREIPMNAQCVVFAESEVVGLIHANTEKKDISKAIHDAMAGRIVSMIRRIGLHPDVVLLGGVGNNPGFIEPIKKELKLKTVMVPEQPEYGPAIGAALVAKAEMMR